MPLTRVIGVFMVYVKLAVSPFKKIQLCTKNSSNSINFIHNIMLNKRLSVKGFESQYLSRTTFSGIQSDGTVWKLAHFERL